MARGLLILECVPETPCPRDPVREPRNWPAHRASCRSRGRLHAHYLTCFHQAPRARPVPQWGQPSRPRSLPSQRSPDCPEGWPKPLPTPCLPTWSAAGPRFQRWRQQVSCHKPARAHLVTMHHAQAGGQTLPEQPPRSPGLKDDLARTHQHSAPRAPGDAPRAPGPGARDTTPHALPPLFLTRPLP